MSMIKTSLSLSLCLSMPVLLMGRGLICTMISFAEIICDTNIQLFPINVIGLLTHKLQMAKIKRRDTERLNITQIVIRLIIII